MDLYAFMDLVQERLGFPMSQTEKEKMVGTLKVAGYQDLSSKETVASALKVVTAQLQRKREKLEQVASTRTASTEMTAAPDSSKQSKFNELNSLNKKGLCGKCKNPTETVKLADSEEANYCPKCRATLWKQ